ncbi:hypothetical protein Btru_069740 [Bulinus truncatus]|nr:hypothetical protein Btru_069740 [Bulinus truncatus]
MAKEATRDTKQFQRAITLSSVATALFGSGESPALDMSPVKEDNPLNDIFVFDERTEVISLAINSFILGVISLTGLVSNTVNMFIFVRLGLKDSMTMELFSLAFSDFFISTLELGITGTFVVKLLYPCSPVDLWSLGYVSFTWAVNAAYLISCWTTALISTERCVSVVLPFRVRRIFTKGTCVVIVVSIFVFHIALFIPAFVVEKLEWVPLNHESQNHSLRSEHERWAYTIVFSEATQVLDAVLDITAGLFLFSTSQLVLLVCSVWMTVSLKMSSAVRTRRRSSAEDLNEKRGTSVHQLSKQETRLIKMVLFLSVLHTVCNVPRLALTVFYHVFSWGDVDSQKNFISKFWAAMTFFSSLTCSSSIWGYYTLNSKYRKVLKELFGIQE